MSQTLTLRARSLKKAVTPMAAMPITSHAALSINGSISDNLIPIPLDVQGDIELTLECWGDVVRVHGNSVSVELIGTAEYVEEFHPSQ